MDASELLRIARDGAELAERSTKGPWGNPYNRLDVRRMIGKSTAAKICECRSFVDADLIAHAGTHYGDICRALVRELESKG